MKDYAKIIVARNVNGALSQGIQYLLQEGIPEQSRNGTVLVAPGPVLTVYEKPCERVLFSPARDANPAFHLMEAIWMLSGRNDISFPAYFNKRFAGYSDDGVSQHGAYGHRWRRWFGYDQLAVIVEELKRDATSRRAVLTMWTPNGDLSPREELFCTGIGELHDNVGGLSSVDVPCNTQAYFDLRDNKLNMTVTCRSNDIIWGAYGANAVHFSILLEYMAAWLEVPVGVYRQFSNNYHVYTDTYDRNALAMISAEAAITDYYTGSRNLQPPLVSTTMKMWDIDLALFMENPDRPGREFKDPFFRSVASPMYKAWKERKDKAGDGLVYANDIAHPDWQIACSSWIRRREAKK